jgi:FkbM family methyltransferase
MAWPPAFNDIELSLLTGPRGWRGIQIMKLLRRAAQELAIATIRNYTVRELPGWGKLAPTFSNHRSDWFWADSPIRNMREKVTGRTMRLNLAHWEDRQTYFLGRWYDTETQAFVHEHVHEGDVVVDIGANRGVFTFLAAYRVGIRGHVYSFEPNPYYADMIRQEIAENSIGNVTVIQAGLSETNGVFSLSVPIRSAGEATFGQTNYAPSELRVVQCKVAKGDEYLADKDPTLIKIDVEGYECKTLRGLRETLTKNKPVVLTEAIPQHLAACGDSIEALSDLMRGLGYEGRRTSGNDIAWFPRPQTIC